MYQRVNAMPPPQQQFTPQQFTPQQFAPMQPPPQQFAPMPPPPMQPPPQQFAPPPQQFAPMPPQQFAPPPQQFAPPPQQQFAPMQPPPQQFAPMPPPQQFNQQQFTPMQPPPQQYGQSPNLQFAPGQAEAYSKSHVKGLAGRFINLLDGPPFGYWGNICVLVIVCCVLLWLIYEYACDVPVLNLLCKFWSFMANILYYIYEGVSWLFNLF